MAAIMTSAENLKFCIFIRDWPAFLLDREFLEKVMNSLTVSERLVLSKFTRIAVRKMCFFSFIDRINFWDFGGHADYDEIRVELYGQTQVRVKLMSSKENLYNSYLTV